MLKMMGWPFILFLLCLLGLTGAGQENVQLISLHHYDKSLPDDVEAMSKSDHPVAVSVRGEDLYGVSSSVLKAEAWLRTNVLTHFPANKITTILVGEDTLCCPNGQDQNSGMVLPTLKNLHHSLTRWSLEREIKVSVALPPSCFDSQSTTLFGGDVADRVTKPLLEFLQTTNSTYSIKLSPKFSPFDHETISMVSSHNDFIKKFGSFNFDRINLIVNHLHHPKPTNRKLSSIDSKAINPYPARPIPLPDTTQPPLHSSVGFSVPSNIAKNPLPRQANPTSPPPLTFPRADSPPPPTPTAPFTHHLPSPPKAGVFPSQPAQSPFPNPAAAPRAYSSPPLTFPRADSPTPPTPTAPFTYHLPSPPKAGDCPSQPAHSPFPTPIAAPHAYSLPPCNPFPPMAPAPEAVGPAQRLWCVAKPNVPAETLQEAMDYACGVGGADCEEITPSRSCFSPDTVVAHASYAFNSYWQKTKRNGGTCSFGGTAMLINSDPSFLHCRFALA